MADLIEQIMNIWDHAYDMCCIVLRLHVIHTIQMIAFGVEYTHTFVILLTLAKHNWRTTKEYLSVRLYECLHHFTQFFLFIVTNSCIHTYIYIDDAKNFLNTEKNWTKESKRIVVFSCDEWFSLVLILYCFYSFSYCVLLATNIWRSNMFVLNPKDSNTNRII